MIGIYKITSPKKKIYIGQSINIERRFATYKRNNPVNKQPRLYGSFKKYGIENHKFEIVCECEIFELNEKERYYQDLFSATGKNSLNCVLQQTKNLDYFSSLETRKKISEKASQETKEKCRLNSTKHLSKIVLCLNNGIFYESAKEVSDIFKIKHSTLRGWLNGSAINKTSFIYV